jgi:hypothetical protein
MLNRGKRSPKKEWKQSYEIEPQMSKIYRYWIIIQRQAKSPPACIGLPGFIINRV